MKHVLNALPLRLPLFPGQKRFKNRGLTLLEIIIVIALIGTIMGIIIVNVTDTADHARIDAAVISMQRLSQNLEAYRAHNFRYPTTEQGLQALITQPTEARRWRGPYTDADRLRDPWDQEFQYESDGQSYRIISAGPSGTFGGDDDIVYPEQSL